MRRFLLIIVSAVFLSASAHIALASSTKSPTLGRTTASAPSDSQIDATIRAKLAKSKIGRDGFRFRVSHGVVTWEGTTNVVQHKGSATRMARAAGAIQVINNIQISEGAKAKAGFNLKKATVQQ
jgi:osmotically-inducible protein OsmY